MVSIHQIMLTILWSTQCHDKRYFPIVLCCRIEPENMQLGRKHLKHALLVWKTTTDTPHPHPAAPHVTLHFHILYRHYTTLHSTRLVPTTALPTMHNIALTIIWHLITYLQYHSVYSAITLLSKATLDCSNKEKLKPQETCDDMKWFRGNKTKSQSRTTCIPVWKMGKVCRLSFEKWAKCAICHLQESFRQRAWLATLQFYLFS